MSQVQYSLSEADGKMNCTLAFMCTKTINLTALRQAKIAYSFGLSVCNRVNRTRTYIFVEQKITGPRGSGFFNSINIQS